MAPGLDLLGAGLRDVGVDPGRLDVHVPQDLLHGADAGPVSINSVAQVWRSMWQLTPWRSIPAFRNASLTMPPLVVGDRFCHSLAKRHSVELSRRSVYDDHRSGLTPTSPRPFDRQTRPPRTKPRPGAIEAPISVKQTDAGRGVSQSVNFSQAERSTPFTMDVAWAPFVPTRFRPYPTPSSRISTLYW